MPIEAALFFMGVVMSKEQQEIEALKSTIDKLTKRVEQLEQKEYWRNNESDLQRKYPSNRLR